MEVFSHSKLSTFEKCPLRYKFQYIDKIRLDIPEGIEAFMGKRVHTILENLYKDLKDSGAPSLKDVLEGFDSCWGNDFCDDIRIVKQEFTGDYYRDLGRKCITNYYLRYQPFTDSETLGLEEKVWLDLDGYKYLGYIDRISRLGDGRYQVHDYKTGGYLPRDEDFQGDRQLTLYQLALQEKYGRASQFELVWHYLVHDRDIRIKRTPLELEMVRNGVLQTISQIEKAKERDDFPPGYSVLCKWCDFEGICPDGVVESSGGNGCSNNSPNISLTKSPNKTGQCKLGDFW